MGTVGTLVVTVLALFLIKKVLDFWNAIKSVHNTPGFRVLLTPNGLPSFLPHIPYISVGPSNKFKPFEMVGADVCTSVSMLPSAEVNILVADAAVIKEVMSNRFKFPKPIEVYEALTPFGPHIVASEHEQWKKYRKVAAPAFTEPNNKLVWNETIRIVDDLFENVWGDQKQVTYDHALDLTMPMALFVIGAAGFGRRIGWKEELVLPPGHKQTFKDALATVSHNAIIKAILPDWAMNMTSKTRGVKVAYDELELYMQEMIASRRISGNKEAKDDLLSGLLDACEGDFDGFSKLSDRELLGNIFIFLIAGHETAAHSLCFGLALLALYQDEQERLYQELMKAFPDGRTPTYEDISKLTYVECVLNETLRLFPPVVSVPKEAAEDTSLVSINALGEKVVIPVPAGTHVNLHIGDLHYNPRYWADPHTFKPSRFLEDWPRDAFLPFSGGVRSCLGRRFAELENLVFLSMLVMKYKVSIKPEPEFACESFEEKKKRIFKYYHGLTITPVRVPLVFTRRE